MREPSKEEIEFLTRKLEEELRERQARRAGICDVRMDVYDDVFNELIRQVCINCPERGSRV